MTSPLGALIKARRTSRGLTAEALGALVDVETSSVRRWERGDALPTPRHMKALRAVLDLALCDADSALLAAVSGAPAMRVEGYGYLQRTGIGMDALVADIMALEARCLPNMTQAETGTVEQWSPIFEMTREYWRLLTVGDQLAGLFQMLPLTSDAYSRLLEGTLRDGEITERDVELPLFEGVYDIYLCSFVIDDPHRGAAAFQMLFAAIVEALAVLSRSRVLFRQIATLPTTPESLRLCERLRFRRYEGRRMPTPEIHVAAMRSLVALRETAAPSDMRQIYEGG